MNEKIVIVKDAFDLKFCNRCFDISADYKASIGAGSVDSSVRKSKVTFLEGVFEHLDIYQPILTFLNQVNKEYFNFHLSAIQPPQLTEYDSVYQGEYKQHKDTAVIQEGEIVRKLSMVVQLTPKDNYEGGELHFKESTDYDVELTKQQGTAIVFPSYLWHGVTPVTSGLRKSLVVWAIGNEFK